MFFHLQSEDHSYHRQKICRHDHIILSVAEKIDGRELIAAVMWEMVLMMTVVVTAAVLEVTAGERLMDMVLVRNHAVGESHQIRERTE